MAVKVPKDLTVFVAAAFGWTESAANRVLSGESESWKVWNLVERVARGEDVLSFLGSNVKGWMLPRAVTARNFLVLVGRRKDARARAAKSKPLVQRR